MSSSPTFNGNASPPTFYSIQNQAIDDITDDGTVSDSSDEATFFRNPDSTSPASTVILNSVQSVSTILRRSSIEQLPQKSSTPSSQEDIEESLQARARAESLDSQVDLDILLEVSLANPIVPSLNRPKPKHNRRSLDTILVNAETSRSSRQIRQSAILRSPRSPDEIDTVVSGEHGITTAGSDPLNWSSGEGIDTPSMAPLTAPPNFDLPSIPAGSTDSLWNPKRSSDPGAPMHHDQNLPDRKDHRVTASSSSAQNPARGTKLIYVPANGLVHAAPPPARKYASELPEADIIRRLSETIKGLENEMGKTKQIEKDATKKMKDAPQPEMTPRVSLPPSDISTEQRGSLSGDDMGASEALTRLSAEQADKVAKRHSRALEKMGMESITSVPSSLKSQSSAEEKDYIDVIPIEMKNGQVRVKSSLMTQAPKLTDDLDVPTQSQPPPKALKMLGLSQDELNQSMGSLDAIDGKSSKKGRKLFGNSTPSRESFKNLLAAGKRIISLSSVDLSQSSSSSQRDSNSSAGSSWGKSNESRPSHDNNNSIFRQSDKSTSTVTRSPPRSKLSHPVDFDPIQNDIQINADGIASVKEDENNSKLTENPSDMLFKQSEVDLDNAFSKEIDVSVESSDNFSETSIPTPKPMILPINTSSEQLKTQKSPEKIHSAAYSESLKEFEGFSYDDLIERSTRSSLWSPATETFNSIAQLSVADSTLMSPNSIKIDSDIKVGSTDKPSTIAEAIKDTESEEFGARKGISSKAIKLLGLSEEELPQLEEEFTLKNILAEESIPGKHEDLLPAVPVGQPSEFSRISTEGSLESRDIPINPVKALKMLGVSQEEVEQVAAATANRRPSRASEVSSSGSILRNSLSRFNSYTKLKNEKDIRTAKTASWIDDARSSTSSVHAANTSLNNSMNAPRLVASSKALRTLGVNSTVEIRDSLKSRLIAERVREVFQINNSPSMEMAPSPELVVDDLDQSGRRRRSSVPENVRFSSSKALWMLGVSNEDINRELRRNQNSPPSSPVPSQTVPGESSGNIVPTEEASKEKALKMLGVSENEAGLVPASQLAEGKSNGGIISVVTHLIGGSSHEELPEYEIVQETSVLSVSSGTKLMSGFLAKVNISPSVSAVFAANKKRFYILTPDRLFMFKSNDSDEISLGHLKIGSRSRVLAYDEGSWRGKNVLEIRSEYVNDPNEDNIWYLQCKDQTEMLIWLRAVKNAIIRDRYAATSQATPLTGPPKSIKAVPTRHLPMRPGQSFAMRVKDMVRSAQTELEDKVAETYNPEHDGLIVSAENMDAVADQSSSLPFEIRANDAVEPVQLINSAIVSTGFMPPSHSRASVVGNSSNPHLSTSSSAAPSLEDGLSPIGSALAMLDAMEEMTRRQQV